MPNPPSVATTDAAITQMAGAVGSVSDEEENLRLMSRIDKYADWQFEQLAPWLHGDVLEIGAGVGTLTKRIISTPRVASCSVTEINPKNLAVLKHALSGQCSVISDVNLEREVPQDFVGHFDTVLSINVMEHVANDASFFANCCRSLKPNGRLVHLVPAKKSLFGTIDSADNHYRRYEPAELKQLAHDNSLRILRCNYFNIFGALGWFYHGKVLKLRKHNAGDLSLMNALVPGLKLFERICPIPFGLSLILVAEKAKPQC